MALARPLFVGFSSASKVAREGRDLEVTVQTARGPRTFTLPWFFVRQVDALLERCRREEHEARLLSMNRDLGRTLCDAARNGGLRDVRFLLARGANLEAAYLFVDDDHWHGSALVMSALRGHLAVCVHLLDVGARRLDCALHCAATRGHTAVVALLLDRGADIHYEEDLPLASAAEGQHLATVTLLLDRGADLHAQDEVALLYAAMKGDLELVRFLLDRGADLRARDDNALGGAAAHGHLEVVRLLLDRGANIHAVNEGALRISRLRRHAAVEALLLERGALEPMGFLGK